MPLNVVGGHPVTEGQLEHKSGCCGDGTGCYGIFPVGFCEGFVLDVELFGCHVCCSLLVYVCLGVASLRYAPSLALRARQGVGAL